MIQMRLYFRLYGKLNSFEIPVNRGSSSTNSCDRGSSPTKGRIAAGPDDHNIYYCHNKKNIRMPVPVEYDTRENGQVVTCLSKSCV